MKLSIIIPVHNEQSTIAKVLWKVKRAETLGYEKEIIVINDGSTDNTKAILEAIQKTMHFQLFSHSFNQGKGAAIRTGLKHINGDLVIIQDADLEYDPDDYKTLLGAANNSLVICGKRGVKKWPEQGLHYVLGAKLLTWLVNLLYGAHLTDLYTGYKLFPSSVIKNIDLKSNGFEFEAEVICKVLKKGIKIKEVPIHYQPRSLKQGKHIGLKDAFKGLLTIVKLKHPAQP